MLVRVHEFNALFTILPISKHHGISSEGHIKLRNTTSHARFQVHSLPRRHEMADASCLEPNKVVGHLHENLGNLLSLLLVHALSALDLLAILEHNHGGELLEVEGLLGRRELVDVDLVGDGRGGVLFRSPAT